MGRKDKSNTGDNITINQVHRVLYGNLIENGGITVRPNVMQKEVIQRIDVDAIVKDATCDFTPTSTVDLTERILTVEEAQVNLQLCINL